MNSQEYIIERLYELADHEFAGAKAWVDHLEFPEHIAWLIEACRALDYQHALQFLSQDPKSKMPRPDFDILVRGWNPLLGLLLPQDGRLQGVPLMECTQESLSFAMTLLHQLGRSVLLKETAAMVRHGIAKGERVDDRIVVKMSERVAAADHFLDQLDAEKLKEFAGEKGFIGDDSTLLDKTRRDDLETRIAALVFPWKSSKGDMIGYHAEPDIDAFFLALVANNTIGWRDESGIHPDAKIGSVSGRELATVGMLLTSFYLKHIHFVSLAKKKLPDTNYPMSLTIWKPRSQVVESLADAAAMTNETVSAAVDLFTLKRSQYNYFQSEPTPFIPMLVEIGEEYLLCPVGSIFRNPFQGIRMLQEQHSDRIQTSIREPREKWMIFDLCHLFLSKRYRIVDGPTRLRRNGEVVTDIDTAIFDRTTGELALFQLKWQDFSSRDIRKQRSRAKNFVNRVDDWANKTAAWIDESGAGSLFRSLRLNVDTDGQISAVRLFAIGRSASRFRSYGFVAECEHLAVCAWPQFVRVRHEVGPVDNVFQSMHDKIRAENIQPIDRKAMPHEIAAAGERILFEDVWGYIAEEKE